MILISFFFLVIFAFPLSFQSWSLKSQDFWQMICCNAGKDRRTIPDFVFLAHVVDVSSSIHAPFVIRSYASLPYQMRLFLLFCWPSAFIVMLMMWVWSKTFLVSFYNLRGRLHETWSVPRFGFQVCFKFWPWILCSNPLLKLARKFLMQIFFMQYFLPFAKEGINKHIEQAILRADRLGVKIISLAALNKVGN